MTLRFPRPSDRSQGRRPTRGARAQSGGTVRGRSSRAEVPRISSCRRPVQIFVSGFLIGLGLQCQTGTHHNCLNVMVEQNGNQSVFQAGHNDSFIGNGSSGRRIRATLDCAASVPDVRSHHRRSTPRNRVSYSRARVRRQQRFVFMLFVVTESRSSGIVRRR